MRFNPGLEGVVIGTTDITFIEGGEGRILYRGYNLYDLVQATFEEVVYLLWFGDLPTPPQLADFRKDLVAERSVPGAVIDILRQLPKTHAPMEILRTLVSTLSHFDEEVNDRSIEARRRKAMRLTSRLPSLVALYSRYRDDQPFIEPDASLSHAANFLYMLRGEVADDEVVRVFDQSLVLQADHEMNSSTFAARVIAATLSDMYSAITGAIGALKGPLQGGANEGVMAMLLEIEEENRTSSWLQEKLDRRERVMGFGHRIYKTVDPRAVELRKAAEALSRRSGEMKWYRICRRLEDVMAKEKGLYPNVDLYSACCYHLMGIPRDLFTPVFAISRISGWIAHTFEQWSHNRLIRPEGEYVGPMFREYKPLTERDTGE